MMHGLAAERSIQEVLRDARTRLAAAPFRPSTREASLLLAHVLGVEEVAILAHGERSLPRGQAVAFQDLLERRLQGEPVAYLTGRREFYGRTFLVDRRVLIPRPETEHLIEVALELDLAPEARALDVGTGSGCLALTLALERPTLRVTATDSSLAALALAAANRHRLGARDVVALMATDLAAGIDLAQFDLVVSNPPYIAPADTEFLSPEILRFEPDLALFAPGDGTSVARRLLSQLRSLRPGSRIVLEIGAGQAEPVTQIAADAGFVVVTVRSDYSGTPRVVLLERRLGG